MDIEQCKKSLKVFFVSSTDCVNALLCPIKPINTSYEYVLCYAKINNIYCEY